MAVDNRPKAHQAKVTLRNRVLDVVRPARVFDAFCGIDGAMHEGAWCRADEYVGVDERWRLSDPRPRYVGDNHIIMRSVDLQRFNVFDFDAYGEPWHHLLILAARRRWGPAEVGAVVTTDGGARKLKFGFGTRAIDTLLGMEHGKKFNPSSHAADALATLAIKAWLVKANVEPMHHWRSVSPGGQTMVYQAIVFRGR